MPKTRDRDREFKGTSVLDPKFVRYYRTMCSNHRSRRKRCIMDPYAVLRIQDAIWSVVSEMYEEKEGGVYVDNIGYFCTVMAKRHSWGICSLNGRPMRQGTNGYLYRPIVFDFRPRQYYHIHKALNMDLTKRMKIKSQSKRLKLFLREVKSYRKCFGDRNIVDVV